MRIVSLPGALMALTLMVPVASAAEDTDIELLRAAIDELRADYDARIMELERRLAIAEQNAAQASYAARSPAPSQAQSSGQAAFNPAPPDGGHPMLPPTRCWPGRLEMAQPGMIFISALNLSPCR